MTNAVQDPEPILISIMRSRPVGEIRYLPGDPIPMTGTSVPGFLAELDRWEAEIRQDQMAKDAEIVRNQVYAPRPSLEITRSVNECDIIVNAALGKAANAISAQS